MKKIFLVLFTLVAFAANSVLCRVALKNGHADPETFGILRLLSGAAVLFLYHFTKGQLKRIRWSITDSVLLMIYVMLFSAAYVELDTATGALLLFGAVQVCMISWGALNGEKTSGLKVAGIMLAVVGIGTLLLPGATTPALFPAMMMVVSGMAWGAYSVRGKKVIDPAGTTAGNFIVSLPVIIVLALIRHEQMSTDLTGAILALVSGGIASAIAYVLWYELVTGFSSATASTLQLSVPCIAAAGGVFLVGEVPSFKMVLCTVVVLTGIAIVIAADSKRAPRL